MAQDDLNVVISARDNLSAIVKKISSNINTLANNFDDLAGALKDVIGLQDRYSQAASSSVRSTKAVATSVKESTKTTNALRESLSRTGRDFAEFANTINTTARGAKNASDNFSSLFADLSSAEIEQLSASLKAAGSSLSQFLSGEKIDLDLAPAVQQLNELQKFLGEPLSLVTDFSSAEEAFEETRRLNEELRKSIDETYDSLVSLGDDSINQRLARQFEPLQELRKVLKDIEGGVSTSPVAGLIGFEEVRAQAQGTVLSIETIQDRLREIGPAAQSGVQKSVEEFLKLTKQLRQAESTAQRLSDSLRESQAQFTSATAGQNASIRALGFREVKLEDIFPSEEQQKIAQIQQRIDNAVRDSVQEGAVKRTLNFFLAQDRQIESVDRNVVSLTSHLPRLRYALYDVSNTATIFGTTIVAAIGATVNLAAEYERAFADVIRTTGVTGEGIDSLRRDLIELSKSIPVSFADLADIATLAGQLNIASDVVADFTDTVAKFAATTDVTIEASATAFGRLDQLVDGVNGQFEKLGSSILAVGINAVATESDIIAISTQIASVANIAGFSAAELIGFSSALASVGTRPELARGTFTRLFTEIQQSVGEGGQQLNDFARIAGQSVEEFTAAWGAGSGAEQVVAILRGLEAEGNNADRALAQLGITSVRDVPTLLKLAQNVEEVERQIAIATLGFEEGTELQEQYGIITETLSEKLAVLKNNFSAVVVALGSISGPIAAGVDVLNLFLGVIERILETRLGGFIAGTLAAFSTVVGLSALAVGALARFGGSLAGAGTAMIELYETVAFTRIQVDQLTGATESNTVATLRKTAADKTVIAQQKAQAVAFARSTVATNRSTISTIKQNTSLTVLRASLASTAAGLDAYIARVRAAGAAALAAAQQTKLYGAAIKTLRAARGIGVFLALSFAIEKATEYMSELNKETEAAEDRFENWGSILEAVKQDSIDFANATEDNIDQFTVIGTSVSDAADEVSNYSRIVAAATDNEDDLAKILDSSADAYDAQTIAIGKNTRALIAQQLAKELAAATEPTFFEEFLASSVESIRQVFSFGLAPESELSRSLLGDKAALDSLIKTIGTDLGAALAESGFDFAEWTRLVTSGSTDAANSLAQKLRPAAQEVLNELRESGKGSAQEIETLEQIISADLVGTLGEFVESGSEINDLLRETKIELAITGALFQDFEEGVDGAEVATDSFKDTLNDIVDAYFAPINAQREMEESIRSLGEVFFNEGAQVAVTSQEMQEAISSIIETASSNEEAATSLGGFFQSIVDGGYASGEQLEVLQDIIINTYRTAVAAQAESLKQAEASIRASIALARISPRAGGGRARGQALAENLAQQEALQDSLQIIQNINTANGNAAQSAGLLAEGYNNARQEAEGTSKAAKDIADETEEASEEVRTLLDYASDLENVFSRAFDLRFGRQSSLDEITDAWEQFTEQVNDARESLEELQASQQDLAADRAIKEYFLSVAEAYDDQLRAAKLRAEIADLDREQAEAARELAEAQETAAGANALTGQGPGARQNRQALLGLVRNYQDYITVLAESGAGQDELRKATEDARKEFIKQARELGFAENEIMMYAEAFDDVRTAIDRVPRDITIDFNADPALQALNELNAKLDQSIEKAKELNRQQRVDPPPQRERTESFEPVIQNTTRAAIIDSVKQSRVLTPIQKIQYEREIRAQVPFFAEGGFTGRGGKFDPAGIVHRGEYVIPKQYVNQSTGLPDPSFLAQLQNGMRSFAQGGFVGGGMSPGDAMMVELSPYDRKLLENAGNVQLRLNGRVVAEATNRSNSNEARRGSN